MKDKLSSSLNFLSRVIESRLQSGSNEDKIHKAIEELPVFEKETILHPLIKILGNYNLNNLEYIIFLLALIPHIRPHFFDELLSNIFPNGGEYPQIGGVRGKNHRGIIPTGETALFILGGEDFKKRFEIQSLFNQEHIFFKKKILWLDESLDNDPQMSGRIILSQDCIDLIVHNKITQPRFGQNFPAERIETLMGWKDIVLNPTTEKQIDELKLWLRHKDTLLNELGLNKKLKPGYRVLFYGPPGTGKTLTATLLGKHCKPKREVFRVDLSIIVSKYIGETEKNLSHLFDRAENKDWILFFDEADALFGKRTQIKDAHDRYANQEIAYLLQRIENYNGLVILASNYKENIDEAFLRRFQAKIYFPLPTVKQRIEIMEKVLPDGYELPDKKELHIICQKYKVSGAAIMNVMQYSLLNCLDKKSKSINTEDILEGIKREFSLNIN